MADETTNPELVRLLAEAAGGADSSMHERIYKTVLASRLILEIEKPPTEGQSGVSLVALKRDDGQTGLAAFTDAEALKRWKPDCEYFVSLPALELFKLARDSSFDAILLNPPEGGWDFMQEDIAALADGRILSASPEIGTLVRVEIHRPAEPIPEAVLAWLRSALASHPEVETCSFFLLAFGADPAFLCLGVRFRGPVEHWKGLMETLEADLAGVPAFGDGFKLAPISDELRAGADRYGVKVV